LSLDTLSTHFELLEFVKKSVLFAYLQPIEALSNTDKFWGLIKRKAL